MTVADERAALISERIAAAKTSLQDSIERLEDARSRLRSTREEISQGRSRRAQLHDSAYGRLQARIASMPVIEQAKGIVMAQTGCDAEQAFDMLRRASQRMNVPVRDLAAQVVDRAETAGEAAAQNGRAHRPGPAEPRRRRPAQPGSPPDPSPA